MLNKYDYFEKLVKILKSAGFDSEPPREINYGLQFNVSINGKKELIRVYESKKGIKVDLSQVKDTENLKIINDNINGGCDKANDTEAQGIPKRAVKAENGSDPDKLIGTDESGKGDYFGPLVIAGVYVDQSTSQVLREMGVDDSKKLTDTKIGKLAAVIKEVCPHSIVDIGNTRYNELYQKFNNLNRMLAWGHARAIENVLDRVECSYALSDQFGDPSLIENALMEKGREIILKQRPRAEENTAVAAASILARNEYVIKMKEIEEKYNMEFPKGASSMVLEAARSFVKKYGMDELVNVAKLHFKTTEQIK